MASPTKKKPRIGTSKKRIILFFSLFLALPVVILGALLPQDLRQRASAIPGGKPNIILISLPAQTPESLTLMPTVSETLGKTGITFQNAFATGNTMPVTMAQDLVGQGYAVANVTDLTAAGDFVNSQTKPYFLTVDLVPEQADPACEEVSVSNRLSVNEENVSDKPAWVKQLPKLTLATLEELAMSERAHLCSLRGVDRSLHELLRTLGSERENTIVIYTAKTGIAFGEHRYVGSACLYDICRRIPLVISYPRMFRDAVTTDELVSDMDIPATIRQLVGLPDEETPAVSLVPFFTRPDVPLRRHVVLTSFSDGTQASSRDLGIRSDTFLYTELGSGERELYDVESDPLQLSNQVTNDTYASIIEDLALELRSYK